MTEQRRGVRSDRDREVARVVDRLRAVVQDAHVSFLVGAGTPSQYFGQLGDVEEALTRIDASSEAAHARAIARASVQALFFDGVIWPNAALIAADEAARAVLLSYARFAQALNRLLIARRSSLLSKQISIFTTNVDLAFEVAFERLGLALNDGFSGRFDPVFDLGSFGMLRFRSSPRYGHRSEVPTFDLYKLHGSIGWCWKGNEPGSDIVFDRSLADVHAARTALDAVRTGLVPLEDPTNLNATDILEAAGRLRRAPGIDAFSRAYDRLVIVNPEKTKFATTVLTETYYELIRRFANELERETSVLFVHGFSFRDEHLREIVVRAARTNPTLHVIAFAYSQADVARYQKLIPDLVIPNRNIEIIGPSSGGTHLSLDEVVDTYLLPLSEHLPERTDEAARIFDEAGAVR